MPPCGLAEILIARTQTAGGLVVACETEGLCQGTNLFVPNRLAFVDCHPERSEAAKRSNAVEDLRFSEYLMDGLDASLAQRDHDLSLPSKIEPERSQSRAARRKKIAPRFSAGYADVKNESPVTGVPDKQQCCACWGG